VLPQLIWASLAAGALGPAIGVFVGGQSAHRQRDDADRRYDLLKRDFEIVSAVNLQLLNRAVSLPVAEATPALQRFHGCVRRCKALSGSRAGRI